MERILDKKKRGVAKLKEMNDLVEGKVRNLNISYSLFLKKV